MRWLGASLVAAIALAGLGLGSARFDAPLAWAASSSPKEGFAPDPPPVASKKQWVFTVVSKESVPTIARASEVELKQAEATPRVMGRFALEFTVGTELLDRHRFDIPLNGDGPRDRDEAGRKRPQFRVNTKFFVRMAHHDRATQLRLVDRATGEVTRFVWPPNKDGTLSIVEPPRPKPSASGSASSEPSASVPKPPEPSASAPKAPPPPPAK
jgi:hypothetical protein